MNYKIINYNSNLKAVFEESIRIKREILSNGSISNLIEMGEIASKAILKKKNTFLWKWRLCCRFSTFSS